MQVLGPRAAAGALHKEESPAEVRPTGVVFGEDDLFHMRWDGAGGVSPNVQGVREELASHVG